MNAADLRALRNPLIALIVVVALGSGAIYFSDYTLNIAKRELARQQGQLRDARTRLNKSGEEKDIIVRYMASYQYLQRLGFAGEEQRINWLDGLRLANQETRAFGVEYQIGVQQPYPYASDLNPGQLSLYQSPMKITVGLLHEGDLMQFLGTLAQQSAGVFSVNQCVLERIETGGSVRLQPNLKAECELAWITTRPSTPGEKKS